MPRTRTTIDRTTVTAVANRMLAHLAASGTKSDADKREAIAAVTSAILLEANAYKGFGYLDSGKTTTPDGIAYDNTRIHYY